MLQYVFALRGCQRLLGKRSQYIGIGVRLLQHLPSRRCDPKALMHDFWHFIHSSFRFFSRGSPRRSVGRSCSSCYFPGPSGAGTLLLENVVVPESCIKRDRKSSVISRTSASSASVA